MLIVVQKQRERATAATKELTVVDNRQTGGLKTAVLCYEILKYKSKRESKRRQTIINQS